jgi:enterochelin esterase-like enzyme
MAGLSMGSRQTLQVTLRNLDKFSWIGFFSGATIQGDLDADYDGVFKDATEFNNRVHLLWMGAGADEPRLIEALNSSHKLLNDRGIQHLVFTSEGTAHEWHSWRRHLNDFAPRLFQLPR